MMRNLLVAECGVSVIAKPVTKVGVVLAIVWTVPGAVIAK
jgi:hypothetical protein